MHLTLTGIFQWSRLRQIQKGTIARIHDIARALDDELSSNIEIQTRFLGSCIVGRFLEIQLARIEFGQSLHILDAKPE